MHSRPTGTDRLPALDPRALTLMIIICTAWGLNHPCTKMSYADISPILAAAMRSLLAAFTFIAPLTGAVFSGWILSDPLTPWLWTGLCLVSTGLVLVNRG